MASAVNSTKGAELIEAQTGRRCTRQNLEKLCLRGALQGSPCVLQSKPLRLDADLLPAEYLARVGQNQSEAQQPTTKPGTRPSGAKLLLLQVSKRTCRRAQ